MKLFWSFARQAFHSTAVFRFEFWLRVVSNFMWMFSAYWLWKVLYAQMPGAFGVSQAQMVTYAGVSAVMLIILRPANSVGYQIASKVKSGEIVMDLLKPLDFHVHILARNIGEVLFAAATLAVPTTLIGLFFLEMRLPGSLGQALLYLLSLGLGIGVTFSLNYLLGLLAIFTIDIRNISWAYQAIIRFFSGSEIPLWLMPVFLARVADVLPFRCIYSIPLSIYIGRLSGVEIGTGLALQAAWLVGLAAAGRMFWRLAYRRLTVQGG